MGYDLDLFFEPPLRSQRVVDYFTARKFYKIEGDKISYEHPDTGVYFWLRLRYAKNVWRQNMVKAAAFKINYNRPSLFGIEAEKELSAFVAAFGPRIEDPQMHGMGEGPYSPRGFLDGWNFGNVFAVSNQLNDDSERAILSLPAGELLEAWEWNYARNARRDTFSRSAFVPFIWFIMVEDRLLRAALWPEGVPILLPKVNIVIVGWWEEGKKCYGLAPWAEAEEVAPRAGYDTAANPVDIRYLVKPTPISHWVANMSYVTKIQYVEPERIIGAELISAARESLGRQQRLP